ncbi:uncharacterized protein LOC126902545 [Daktulosphaira vitifoliae]|uniref:uncharacterized protein LOC126902545 n=1 Tax=Daktulosphaira vitifoliae TaxID=58002 RepID=UPI0021AAE252|nr:uncharacterized protein LOC126902545 [Daktulosphaira vitifoliae]
MASDKKSFVDKIVSYRPPALDKTSAINFYVPAFGSLNYTILSINVMNPGLLQRIIPKPDLTNLLLLNSCVGSTLFIVSRPHLRSSPLKIRVLYSVYGSVLFNMGSVLSWAIIRSLLPNNTAIATLAGIFSGFAITSCGVAYLEHNDKNFKS